jgi:hypothetical protein
MSPAPPADAPPIIGLFAGQGSLFLCTRRVARKIALSLED